MKPKIGPLAVWIVGHTQNPLISETPGEGKPLAVFYKKKDALAYRRKNESIRRVYAATILRKGTGADYRAQRDDLAGQLEMERIEVGNLKDALAKSQAAHTATAQELYDLQDGIHAGKIWNKENPRWTPRTQSAIALAEKEAQAQGSTHVGTDHLLLGLLKQGEGGASRHFLAAGMTYDKAEYAMRVGRCS